MPFLATFQSFNYDTLPNCTFTTSQSMIRKKAILPTIYGLEYNSTQPFLATLLPIHNHEQTPSLATFTVIINPHQPHFNLSNLSCRMFHMFLLNNWRDSPWFARQSSSRQFSKVMWYPIGNCCFGAALEYHAHTCLMLDPSLAITLSVL